MNSIFSEQKERVPLKTFIEENLTESTHENMTNSHDEASNSNSMEINPKKIESKKYSITYISDE